MVLVAPATANVHRQAGARHRRRPAHDGAPRHARAAAARAGDERAHVGARGDAGEPARAASSGASHRSGPAADRSPAATRARGGWPSRRRSSRRSTGRAGARRTCGASASLVSAGPTREAIDPVRYLSNHSSGKMGYAIARVARRRGADVMLVSGPTALPPPPGVRTRAGHDRGRDAARRSRSSSAPPACW